MKKMLYSAAIAGTALMGALAATPASAQAYGYYDAPSSYYDQGYRGDYYDRGYDRRAYREDYRDYRRDRRYYRGDRCRSGTTGTIVGGVVGALLGGEIGRGSSRWSRRSTTGTIIGAGAGALLGNEVEKSSCRDSYYRR
ncbi:hypothetical protein DMC47_15270 [Nostoc sp. 3335mG]|jgi:uncharacterized protein YcfJ|nr:hypothetical protein DMC47_15270 [Nostoc sp. 3335mG]